MQHSMVSTGNEIHGFKITQSLGVVRGITVRSASIGNNITAGLKSLFGGKIDEYVALCEQTREEAFDSMIKHAEDLGANGIINMRYDANEVMTGFTEVLAYGTAVILEKY
jgi:uncharacterized protein YbjQ (UPF0145 family)